MDEWSQLGEIPRFVEELAYLREIKCWNYCRFAIIKPIKTKSIRIVGNRF